VAQANLVLRGAGLPGRDVHRAGRGCRCAEGVVEVRACWWAVGQLRREHASVSGLARQLGTTWRTVWRAIRPLLEAMAADPARFDAVTILGVDEHIWHHVSVKERGPKELTGMVDLTRDKDGETRARLLDLVPGRSGAAYGDWLRERGEAFRAQVKIATLDPFHGYKNAIDDQLEDAIAVVDAFHVVKLGGHAVDEVRRRVQQETLGHRGRAGDALYGIRTILRCGREHLTERQQARLARAIAADERHDEVHIAWQAGQQPRAVTSIFEFETEPKPPSSATSADSKPSATASPSNRSPDRTGPLHRPAQSPLFSS